MVFLQNVLYSILASLDFQKVPDLEAKASLKRQTFSILSLLDC